MINDFTADLRFLLARQWDNDYLRLLAISDHLTECKAKYERYKMASVNADFTSNELKEELFKELVDLNILLDMCHLKLGSALYAERIEKFKSKLPPESVAKIAVVILEDDEDKDSPSMMMFSVDSLNEAYSKAVDETYGLYTYMGIELYDVILGGSVIPPDCKSCTHQYFEGKKVKGEEN